MIALRGEADRAFERLLERVARARSGESERAHREVATTVWAALHGLSLLAIDGTLRNWFPEHEARRRRACRAIVGMVGASSG